MVKQKQTQKREAAKEESKGAGKPITFHPLSFEDALDALLVTPPEPKGETKKPRTTKPKRKG
jgi:hypothetical protein